MVKITQQKPIKRRFFCECELPDCESCNGGGKIISVNDIYELIKNPKPEILQCFLLPHNRIGCFIPITEAYQY